MASRRPRHLRGFRQTKVTLDLGDPLQQHRQRLVHCGALLQPADLDITRRAAVPALGSAQSITAPTGPRASRPRATAMAYAAAADRREAGIRAG
jgi:hypothetical protein